MQHSQYFNLYWLQLSAEEIEDFKKDYCGHVGGKYNLKVQVPHLAKLADRYLQRYKDSGQWTDALKVQNFVNMRFCFQNLEKQIYHPLPLSDVSRQKIVVKRQ